jgi:hypothetical protein
MNSLQKSKKHSLEDILTSISTLGSSILNSISKTTNKVYTEQPLLITESHSVAHAPVPQPFKEAFKENPVEAIKSALNKPLPNSKNTKLAVKDLVVGLGAIGSTVGVASYGIGKSLSPPNTKEFKKFLTETLGFPPDFVKRIHFITPSLSLMPIFVDVFIQRAKYRIPLQLSSYIEYEIASLTVDRSAHLWTTDPEYLPLSESAFRPVTLSTDGNPNAQRIRRWCPLNTPELQFPLCSLLELSRPNRALNLFNANRIFGLEVKDVKTLGLREIILDSTILSKGYHVFEDDFDALLDFRIPLSIPSIVMNSLMNRLTPTFTELETMILQSLRIELGTEPQLMRIPITKTSPSKYTHPKSELYDLVWESETSDIDMHFFHANRTKAPFQAPSNGLKDKKANNGGFL